MWTVLQNLPCRTPKVPQKFGEPLRPGPGPASFPPKWEKHLWQISRRFCFEERTHHVMDVSCWLFRKLDKALAVSGILSRAREDNFREKLGIFPDRQMLWFLSFVTFSSRTLGLDTALHLVPTFCARCFWKAVYSLLDSSLLNFVFFFLVELLKNNAPGIPIDAVSCQEHTSTSPSAIGPNRSHSRLPNFKTHKALSYSVNRNSPLNESAAERRVFGMGSPRISCAEFSSIFVCTGMGFLQSRVVLCNMHTTLSTWMCRSEEPCRIPKKNSCEHQNTWKVMQ